MGQIKTMYVKNLARKLIEIFPDKFTKNFEKNKEWIDKVVQLESKTIRNKVAGYLTHLVEKKEKPVGFEVTLQKKERERRRRR